MIGDPFPKQRKLSRRVKRNKSEQIAAFIGAKKRPRGRSFEKGNQFGAEHRFQKGQPALNPAGRPRCKEITKAIREQPASFTYQVIVLNPYPAVSVTPTTLSFGSVPIGEPSDPQTFALENTGHVDLKITSIVVSTNFAVFSIISDDCPAVLSGGDSCDVQLEFTPTKAGAIVGEVKISDNAFPQGSFPSTVHLTGTGAKP